MPDMNMDALAVVFRHMQMGALPYIPYDDAEDGGTPLATRQWVLDATERGRHHDEIDQVGQIAKFRLMNKEVHNMLEPRDALLRHHTHFQEYLDMFHYTTPVPSLLTDDWSINVRHMWPPMIRDIQRYATIRWALESPSFATPLLIQPGHPLFSQVRASEPMNNPAFRDRTGGCGVVERFALAFYCQLRFHSHNRARHFANKSMVEGFVLSGALRVVLDLMESYPGNESIQVYLCFFLRIFFLYGEHVLFVLKFGPLHTHLHSLHEVMGAQTFVEARMCMEDLKPRVSRNICAAVQRFPYMMIMRHLRGLGRYMTDDAKTSCNWQECTWYGD